MSAAAKVSLGIAGMLSVMFCTAHLQAETLETSDGVVRVNSGRGFRIVQNSGTVWSGDAILADTKSRARLVYADGCIVPIGSEAIVFVTDVSPCSMTAQAGVVEGTVAAGGGFGANVGVAVVGGALGAGAATASAVSAANATRSAEQSAGRNLQNLAQLLALSRTPPSSP